MKRSTGMAVVGVVAVLTVLAAEGSQGVGAAPARQVTYTGRVLDAAGQPLEGVKVRLYQETYGGAPHLYETTLAAEAAVRADGSFSFAVPAESESHRSGYVVAAKAGLAIGFDSWDMRQDKQRDLTLGEARPLAGVVVDETGRPVPDASVSVYILQIGDVMRQQGLGMHLAPQLLTTRTDPAGRFAFPNLPEEATAELLVKKPGRATLCTYAPRAYAGQSLSYRVGQTDVRLTQPAETRIEGNVVQKPTGQPVAGLTLLVTYAGNRLLDGHDPVRVNTDGTFTIPALPGGDYSLQLATPRDEMAQWVAAPVPVAVPSGQAVTGVRIEVSPGGILEVVVTEAATNQPVEKASVSARAAHGGQWTHGATDAEGIARLRLAPGTYQVHGPTKQGYSYTQQPQTVTIEEGATKRITAALTEAPRIRGIVRDPDGAPVAGARVRLMPAGYQDTFADADGRFEIVWDRGGWPADRTTFCLLARHEQRNLVAAVEIGEGASTLDVKLEPGVVLAGRVVDPDGKGLAGARIMPMLNMSNWGSSLTGGQVPTDGSGNFEVRAAPAGRKYSIYASADGYGSTRSEQVQADDAVKDRLDVGVFTLPLANLAVSGQVVDLEDRPVANASLTVSGYGDGQPDRLHAQTDAEVKIEQTSRASFSHLGFDRDRTLTTDAEGRFRFEHVSTTMRTDHNNDVYIPRTWKLSHGAASETVAFDDGQTLKEVDLILKPDAANAPPLAGRPLPGFEGIKIDLTPEQRKGKRVLVCFFDWEQRPSRNQVLQLAKQAEALKERNVLIAVVHVSKADDATVRKWAADSKIPFPVGMIQGDKDEVLATWSVKSLPWLILTDAGHVVTAEGFAPDDLNRKLDEAGNTDR
ncbi:MAG: redoxin domain-containing protein [Planctomycetes bacterium]|nr:redoxin domain-containing protein [Planctomycetota bacterium]